MYDTTSFVRLVDIFEGDCTYVLHDHKYPQGDFVRSVYYIY